MAKDYRMNDTAAPTIGRPDESASYMPARFKDEVERPEDGISDVVTPAVIDLVVADRMRDQATWSQVPDAESYPAAATFDRWISSESFRLAMSIVWLAGSDEGMARAVSRTNDAYIEIDELVKISPEHAERIERIAGKLLSGCFEVAKSLTLAGHARQNSTMRPLAEANAVKANVINRAKAIATEKWQANTAQKIRISKMADCVYQALLDEGFAESLPGNADRIKDWIRPVAPDYAKQGGAPKGPRRRKPT